MAWLIPMPYLLKLFRLRDRYLKLRQTYSSETVHWFYEDGMKYFIFHPALWPPFGGVVLPLLVVLLSVMSFWYTVALPPQMAVLIVLNGPMGIVSSVFLVFNQATMIYSTIANSFFMKKALKTTFDRVMRMEGYDDLVANAPLVDEDEEEAIQKSGTDDAPDGETPPEDDTGRIRKLYNATVVRIRNKWRSFKQKLASPYLFMKSVVLFPLKFIPFVGPFIHAIVHAVDIARARQMRWFQLKRFTPKEIRIYTRRLYGGYFAFGTVAGVLESIPILGLIFQFTNTTGAALWAAQMEGKLRKNEGGMLMSYHEEFNPYWIDGEPVYPYPPLPDST
ncbi:hypothetical protein V1511DRAFT_510990 [Dipodascopsis uninucleata]